MKTAGVRASWMIGSALIAACSAGESIRSGEPVQAVEPRPAGARASDETRAGHSLLIMTYNVNFGRAGDAETIEVIRAADADVVLLQETNHIWEAALRASLSDVYEHMAFHHSGRRAGGLGFLSRYPLEADRLQPSPIGWFPAWRAVLRGPLGGIQLLNLHLRPPGRDEGSIVRGYFTSQSERLNETEAHVRLLDPSMPAVVAGDFNEDVRGRSLVLLAKQGLESVLERFHPAQWTWRWETHMGMVRWQLDHILLGPALRASAAWIVDGGTSDHVPVLARIERADADAAHR